MKQSIKEPVLCYVQGCFAFFTTQELEKQWGDDWDDAPYEHNAGGPYTGDKWQIVKVAFDTDLQTPSDGHNNSPYSVEMINKGHAPWLRDAYGGSKVAIPAGVTISEFVKLIHKAGGDVYTKENK